MEKYTIGELLRFILKKAWLIIISILVFAVLLGIPKISNVTTKEIHVYTSNQLVQFQNHAMYPLMGDEKNSQYHNYSDIWFRNAVLADFIDSISEKYEMEKFNPEWDRLDESLKADWIRSTFKSASISNTPNYEFSLTLEVVGDSNAYVSEHIKGLFDDFISFAADSIKFLAPNSAYTVLSRMDSTNVNSDSESFISKKYFIVGAVLGLIMGVFIVCVWFLASRKVVSKSFFAKEYQVDMLENSKQLPYDVFNYAVMQMNKRGKKTMALCSSYNDNSVAQQVIQCFCQSGYHVRLTNLSGTDFHVSSEVKMVPTTESSLPMKPDEFLRAADNDEYIIIVLPAPSANSASANVMLDCACSILVEKTGVSLRADLKNSIEWLQKADVDCSICIAWNG